MTSPGTKIRNCEGTRYLKSRDKSGSRVIELYPYRPALFERDLRRSVTSPATVDQTANPPTKTHKYALRTLVQDDVPCENTNTYYEPQYKTTYLAKISSEYNSDEGLTMEELDLFLIIKLDEYPEKYYNEEVLWYIFQDDFKDWTEEHFRLASIGLTSKLRSLLR